MILYHTTPKYNLPSIRELGVCVRYSQGKLRAVWLHTDERIGWAWLHTVRRHGGDVRDVVTVVVDVDESRLKRSSVDGLFYVLEDVVPEAIVATMNFEFVSRSPLGGR
jgi:hypothetical protein